VDAVRRDGDARRAGRGLRAFVDGGRIRGRRFGLAAGKECEGGEQSGQCFAQAEL
jgi:hypothetical protein